MENKKNVEKRKNHCNICDKTIVGSSYKFKAHLYKHKAVQSRFKCSFCSKEFFRSDAYSKHVDTHTGASPKKTYICDHCDRGFVNKRNLLLHLKIHDDSLEHPYKCVACGVTYCEERLLKYHIRKTHYNLHLDETPHIMKEINETWVERVKESQVCVQMTKVNNNTLSIQKYGTLKEENEKNINMDSEKVRFKEYITSVFAQKDKSQYSKATCDYCHKEMLKKSLLSHIRERHLKIRKFKCEKCNCTFKRHYQMVDHVCGKYRQRRRKK
ncbi:zinc finger protein 62 homolog [Pectinophora gossypiella]|uniref:C2H2-type domain-containing protein n=1 Tax=Pectinophora gossypiella TaxID=13191 RepID=A0A1E1WN73_PECGO|nr:zinc finger protein 62 homolog [Pectinophora gossypiella]